MQQGSDVECSLGITLGEAVTAIIMLGGGLVSAVVVLWSRCVKITQEALEAERRGRARALEIQEAMLKTAGARRSEHGGNGT